MSWVRSIRRTDRLRRNREEAGSPIGHRRDPVTPPVDKPVGWLSGNEGDIPVFSLASRLGRPFLASLPAEGGHGNSQRIIVLDPPQSNSQMDIWEGMRPWALLVDRVSQVSQVQPGQMMPLPPIPVSPYADYFECVIKVDERLILLLSPERLHPEALADVRAKVDETANPAAVTGTSPSEPNSIGPHHSHGQIVVFQVTEPHPTERATSFGLSISQVREIAESPPIIPIPGAPASVSGLVDWRGLPVPIIDIAERLGLAQAPADRRTRLVIARDRETSGKGALVGLMSQPAIRLLRLPVAHLPSKRPLHLDPALTRGVFELEGETLVIPDIQGILRQDR
jgi:purine-binding chemotaxis protein CheW